MICIKENEIENRNVIFDDYFNLNKVYNFLNDVVDIKLNKNKVIFTFKITKNKMIKINNLIIPKNIIKYLRDIFVMEKNEKICDKKNYNKKVLNGNNEIFLNLSFDKNKFDEIINEKIILNYTVINKKNKSKIYSIIE